MTKLSIYLAGPITEVSREEAWGWRNEFKTKYNNKFEIKNPLERDHLYKDFSGYELYAAIANDERKDILNCDVLIANISCSSMGTAMGIMYAFLSGRTVVVVTDIPDDKLSKMVLYHAHKICDNFDEAVEYIEKRHERSNVKMILKRDGSKIVWDPSRITNAIQAAIDDTYSEQQKAPEYQPPKAEILSTAVIMQIEDYIEKGIIIIEELSIEIIQDMVEKVLMDNAHRSEVHTLSKAYIIYRRKRQEYRDKYIEDNEINQFIHEMLHDFKSPVGNIKRLCGFMKDALKNEDIEDAKGILNDIYNNELSLDKYILTIKAKADNKYQKSIICIKDIFNELEKNYSFNKKMTFHNEIQDDLFVESPPDKIKTIFNVLIENSIKHGFKNKKGNVYIKVKKKNEGNLRIQYWNDETMITKMQAERIFYGEKKSNSDINDYQFGLTQVKRYVEQLAGAIECIPVVKEPGDFEKLNISERGFPVFVIDIPIYRGKLNKALKTILIADDIANDRKMIKRILGNKSYKTIEAETIDKALIIAKEEDIYGAVLDVDFKEDRNGIWLLKEIKKMKPNIRVVVISGSDSQSTFDWQNQALKNGALEVFEKSKYSSEDIEKCFSS